MKDQDRELIEQVLSAAGTAGVQGWGYAVHWVFVDGLLSIVGYLVLLIAALYLLKRAFAWKPTDSFDDEPKQLARGASILILCAVSALCFAGAVNGVRDAIAPEGAAVMKILSH